MEKLEKTKEIISNLQDNLRSQIKLLKTNSSKKMKLRSQIEILDLLKIQLNQIDPQNDLSSSIELNKSNTEGEKENA